MLALAHVCVTEKHRHPDFQALVEEKSIISINQCACILWASPLAPVLKNPPANAGDIRDVCSIPGLRRSPGGGHSTPLQYSCLENPHGQRSQAGYSLWGHRESDTTQQTHTLEHRRASFILACSSSSFTEGRNCLADSLWFFSLWELLEFDITTYLFSSFPMILRRKRRRKRNFLLNIFFWGHFSVLNGSSLLTSIALNLYIFQSIFVYIFSFFRQQFCELTQTGVLILLMKKLMEKGYMF